MTSANDMTNEDPLTDEDITQALKPSRRILRETFDKADVNKDGVVNRKEMIKFLRERGVNVSRAQSFKSFFRTKDMSFEEFCSEIDSKKCARTKKSKKTHKNGGNVVQIRETDKSVDHYRDIFKFLDVNGDGQITANEMRERMAIAGTEYTEQQIEEMVAMADTNQDKLIDFDEFVLLMKRLAVQKRNSVNRLSTQKTTKTISGDDHDDEEEEDEKIAHGSVTRDVDASCSNNQASGDCTVEGGLKNRRENDAPDNVIVLDHDEEPVVFGESSLKVQHQDDAELAANQGTFGNVEESSEQEINFIQTHSSKL